MQLRAYSKDSFVKRLYAFRDPPNHIDACLSIIFTFLSSKYGGGGKHLSTQNMYFPSNTDVFFFENGLVTLYH